jgi:hypothetical protein
VDRAQFEAAVRRTGAEDRTKGFSCWEQFVAMSFCQLAQAKSLRERSDLHPYRSKCLYAVLRLTPNCSHRSVTVKRPMKLLAKKTD